MLCFGPVFALSRMLLVSVHTVIVLPSKPTYTAPLVTCIFGCFFLLPPSLSFLLCMSVFHAHFKNSILSSAIILIFLKNILIPFLIAVFFMYLLDPIVGWISTTPFKCWTAVLRHARQGQYHDDGIPPQPHSSFLRTLAHMHIPRWISVICALAIAVGCMVSVVLVCISGVEDLSSRYAIYENEAFRLTDKIRTFYGIDIPVRFELYFVSHIKLFVHEASELFLIV